MESLENLASENIPSNPKVVNNIYEPKKSNCGYCGNVLPEDHVITFYGGEYCNSYCQQMFTEA